MTAYNKKFLELTDDICQNEFIKEDNDHKGNGNGKGNGKHDSSKNDELETVEKELIGK